MSVSQSLLAILDQGACYGYQLRAEFDRRTGGGWPLNAGQIYNTLDRLTRDGLVQKAETGRDGQIHYTITSTGREQVAHWLSSPVVRAGAPRDEVAIKLALAATLPGVDITALIEAQRSATMRRLAELGGTAAAEPPRSAGELAALIVRDSLAFAAEAELRWLEQTRSRLAGAADAGLMTAFPLSPDTPKRGRPAKVSRG